MRVDDYRKLVTEKGNGFYKKDLGDCVALGVDRRTGRVYEGINGRTNNLIPGDEVHPAIRGRVDAILESGPYPDDLGNLTFDFPHPDEPLRHAEVKASNMALHDRSASGLPDDSSVMSELTMNTHFAYMGGGMPAPFCANCHKGFTSIAKLGKLWKAGGLRALGGGALKGIGGGLKNVAASIRRARNTIMIWPS